MAEETLVERARRRRRELGLVPTKEEAFVFDPDLIPDLGDDGPRVRTPEDDDIDRVIGAIDIVQAYRRWCGKMEPRDHGGDESIMVSCPFPGHEDKNPSAWLNRDKNVGNCAVCGGFDRFDLAAWHFGFDVPGYKHGSSFPELRRRIAEDLGYVVKKTISGDEYVEKVVEAPESEPEALAPVVSITRHEERDLIPEDDAPTVGWRGIVPADTFLGKWMEACTEDELPEEYYFWLGLQAVGFAAGNNVVMADRKPVRANLMICLTGPSGIGKSRSADALFDLLDQALPWDPTTSAGVKVINGAKSAEYLVDEFVNPIYDPADPKTVLGYGEVKGLVAFNEFSGLAGQAQRSGNLMKPTIMEFYDSVRPVTTGSRGSGTRTAPKHFMQAVSTTQPSVLRDLLDASDAMSGFVNRWVFVYGQPKTLVSLGGTRLDLTPAVDPLRDLRAWCASGRSLGMSAGAYTAWDEFFHENLAALKTSEDSHIWARSDLLMKKIILLLAVNKREPLVSSDTVEEALNLWGYVSTVLEKSAGAIEVDADREIADLVMAAIKTRGGSATARELVRILPKRCTYEKVRRALQYLTEFEFVEEERLKPKTGRPTVRYRSLEK